MSPEDKKSLQEDASVLEIGERLDNDQYEIIDIIGTGGFGIVYHVKRVSDSEEFAVKELLIKGVCSRKRNSTKIVAKQSNIFKSFKERVKKEVAFLSQNNNENIIHTYDCFEENNTIYTRMEYIDGYDLAQLIEYRKKTFREDEVIDLLQQLSKGFRKIHNQNIIHRDIKPNNIIRTSENIYKLIDFTNIKMFLEEERGIVTELGVGSKSFSPPELISRTDNEIGVYSDIYSLGMTIYCCFSGQLNIPSSTQRYIKDAFVEDIEELEISDKFKSLIKKMTKLDKKERFQSLDEVLDFIEPQRTEPDDPFPETKWYEDFFKSIKNIFSSFSVPTLSLPSFNLNPLKNSLVKIFGLSKNLIILLFKVIGTIFVLYVIYLIFQKEPDSPCSTPEKMKLCEQRYREIAFAKNPQISDLYEFKELVRAGVRINEIKNKDGETGLNHLAYKGAYEFVKVLVEKGIDVNIKDNKGETGLYEAIAYYPDHKNASLKMIKLLMDNGVDIAVRRNVKEKNSILSLAVSYKLVDIVDELVNRGICSYEKGRKYYKKDIFDVLESAKGDKKKEAEKIKKILKKGGC